jgi:hypothetical protein
MPSNTSKGKIETKFFLPLSLGNTARHPQELHPRKSIIHQVNGSPREYTHTRMGKGELKRSSTWPSLEVSPIKRDAVYLHKKMSTMSYKIHLQKQ